MNDTMRILAQGELMSSNTRETGINNNDLIIGPSGAGKTRSYVKPNIMQCSESMIITDTKGALAGELAPLLRRHGYRVISIDFTDTLGSDGYNPLDYIRCDTRQGRYSEQDILTLCDALIPTGTRYDSFWEQSARTLLSCLVGFVMESLPQEEHTLEYVVKLFAMDDGFPENPQRIYQQLLKDYAQDRPDSFASRQFSFYSVLQGSDKTEACVQAYLSRALAPLCYDGPLHMYQLKNSCRYLLLVIVPC